MSAPSPPLRRDPAERLVAWVVTGPLGHLWSAVADISSFVLRSGWARARRRLARRRGGDGFPAS